MTRQLGQKEGRVKEQDSQEQTKAQTAKTTLSFICSIIKHEIGWVTLDTLQPELKCTSESDTLNQRRRAAKEDTFYSYAIIAFMLPPKHTRTHVFKDLGVKKVCNTEL